MKGSLPSQIGLGQTGAPVQKGTGSHDADRAFFRESIQNIRKLQKVFRRRVKNFLPDLFRLLPGITAEKPVVRERSLFAGSEEGIQIVQRGYDIFVQTFAFRDKRSEEIRGILIYPERTVGSRIPVRIGENVPVPVGLESAAVSTALYADPVPEE